MDASPVDVIVESRPVCPDAAPARASLEEALAAARAPRRRPASRGSEGEAPRWIMTVRFARDGESARAEAVIVDDAGAEVARRVLAERGRACLPLTRAVGAWASLVLDAELARTHDAPVRDRGASSGDVSAATGVSLAPHPGSGYQLPIAPPDRVVAEERERAIELGALGFFRSGVVSASSVAGVSPFVNVQVSPTIFLRPSLAVGWSTERASTGNGTSSRYLSYALRFDACRRIPGNYIERHGIELDLCAGTDVAHVATASSLYALRATAGPSAVLRGELGAGLALELRGVAGVNLARAPLGNEDRVALLSAAGEVGISARWP